MARPSKYSPKCASASGWCGARRRARVAVGGDSAIAPKVGCTAETLRRWVRQAERDAGQRPGLTTDERAAAEGAGARESSS